MTRLRQCNKAAPCTLFCTCTCRTASSRSPRSILARLPIQASHVDELQGASSDALEVCNLACHCLQKFLIFGKSGWIGGLLGEILKEQGASYEYANARLEDRAAVIADIERVR